MNKVPFQTPRQRRSSGAFGGGGAPIGVTRAEAARLALDAANRLGTNELK